MISCIITAQTMIVHNVPGYYAHRTIPARAGSKQAYLMQPLDVRRHHKLYVDDIKWTVGLERMMRKRVSALLEHLTLEREQMRKEFVFKVFGLLSCQLLYILINMLVLFSVGSFKKFFQDDFLIYFFLGIAAVIYLSLLFIKDLRKKRLVNFTLITLLVFFLALGLSAYGSANGMYVYAVTVGIQYSVVIFVTVLAKFGPCDVAGCSMICCVLALVFCIYGVVASLIILLAGFGISDLIIAGLAVTIISVYLMFDTQAMLENKSLKMSSHEFVRGNIHLYIDIFLILYRIIRAAFKPLKNMLKRTNKT